MKENAYQKGNDLNINWRILVINSADGASAPYVLEGKNLTVSMRCGARTVPVSAFAVSGNVLSFTYFGKDQQLTGIYDLVLTENNGMPGMRTKIQEAAFEIYSSRRDRRGCLRPCPNVSIETLELTSVISVLAESVIPDSIARREEMLELLGGKVDKVPGKGLSANDYTDDDRDKLAGIEDGAQANDPNTAIDPDYVHTDNNYTGQEKEKLARIEDGAQVNDPDTAIDPNYVHTDNNFTDAHKEKLEGLYTPMYDEATESVAFPGDGQVEYDSEEEIIKFNN